MNLFFFSHSEIYKSELTVPKFQNYGLRKANISLFACTSINNKWQFYKPDSEETSDFYKIKSSSENIHDVFFMCSDKEFEIISEGSEILDINNFTITSPDFRANLAVTLGKNSSSYQSEYPISMAKRSGSVFNVVSVLTDDRAKRKTLSLRNISTHGDVFEKKVVFFSLKDESVIKEEIVYTNRANLIDLDFIGQDSSVGFVGNLMAIPIICLEYESGLLSFEHTHPPHEHLSPSNAHGIIKKKREYLFEKYF